MKRCGLFYTSLFFGHADGETVAKAMYSKMVEDGLPVDQMATLVRDGPNVNKTIFRNMNKLIQEDHPQFTGLVDLGSCTIQYTQFTMHSTKAWNNMEEKLTNCVLISSHC